MRRFSIFASLALALSATPGFAQAPAQTAPAPRPSTQAPAQTAPAPRPATPAPPAPAQPPAPFPQGAKIAFVDFQRVAQESAEGQASSGKINALVQKKQAEGAEKAKQLQTNQQKLQQSGGVMSDQARTQLEADISRQQREAERFQQDAQAEVAELQQELQREFERKIVPLLQQVAQEKGLQLLLSRAESGIVWWDPGIDLTSEVVKKLDAAAAAPKPAAAAPAAAPTAAPPAAAAPATPAAPKK
jgi:outer membrane protein